MTLQRKLMLFVVLAALAPLVGVAFAVLGSAQAELSRRAAAEHLARARAGAIATSAGLSEVDGALGALAETWRPDRLGEEELRGLLVVLSRQVPSADASAVVDGAGSARAVLAEGAGPATDAFVSALRTSAAGEAGGLVLRAYDDPVGGWRLAALRGVRAADGRRWLVGVRLSPQAARARLDGAVPEGGAAYLVDGERVLLASSGAGPLRPEQREELAGRLDPGRASAVQGERVLAAYAPLGDGTGWGVLVAVPAATAYAQVVSLRRGVLVASAAVLGAVLLVSFLLGRGTAAGLARIESAARALGAGELAVRLPVEGSDEVTQVSRTFNLMAEELQRSRERLERWNEELQREVEARARELEQAQARLLETQKLAAVGQLGAGVAHEINNPLTGILGNAQLLLAAGPGRPPDREALGEIERLARRCRDVTQNLLRFSEQRAEADLRPADLNRIVRDALSLVEEQVRASGVELSLDLAEPPPRVRGDPRQLAQVVLHLVSNARTACADRPGGKVRISTRAEGGEARLEVKDDGKGIAPEHLPHVFEPFFTTKDQWSNVGLGLSVSFRIVAEHGGRIAVESRPGEGATFTVSLPAAKGE